MAAKKQQTNQRSKKKEVQNKTSSKNTSGTPSASFQNEIMLLIVLAASVIFLISALGFGGIVGNVISNVLFGLIGYMAYAFPFIFFIGSAFILSNRTSRIALRKLISGIVFFLFLCAFLQMVTEGVLPGYRLMDYYDLCGLYKTGGGIVGGAVCFSSITAFGTVGGMIIIVLVLFISVIVMTQRSFFGFIFKISDAFTNSVDRGRERYAQGEPERQLKREQKELRRQKLREQKRQQKLQELEAAYAMEQEELKKAASRKKSESQDAAAPKSESSDESVSKTTAAPAMEEGFLAGTWLERREPKKQSPSYMEDPITLTQQPREIRPYVEVPAQDTDTWENSPSEEPASGSANPDNANIESAVLEEEPASRQNTPKFTEEEPVFTVHRTIEEPSSPDMNTEEDSEFPEESEEEDFYDPYEGTSSESPASESTNSADSRTENAAANGSGSRKTHSSPQEIQQGIHNVAAEIQKQETQKPKVYHYPPLRLLKKGSGSSQGDTDDHLRQTAKKLQDTLYNFGVNAKVVNVSCGPTVTRYELQPEMGVKVSRIVGLTDDIKLNLAAEDIRIEAPIPGKAAVGIEVPNKETSPVYLRDLLESKAFQDSKSRLSFAAGKDIAGKPVVTDIAKMPHLLIAGSTGSGKSVCINTLIISILYKASPEDVKLILIDPKVVELSVYNGIPHLYIPVVTDPKKAAGALNWAVTEMSHRYDTFAEYGVRNLGEYNKKIQDIPVAEGEQPPKKMPQIVIIVDELADLMMVAKGEVEEAICRLAQLARAAGIHLVIATQRPSVDVITGLIKANMPSRIAFAVSSGTDSRTILDMNGAEKLLGKGDMLFYPQGYPKPARLQGAFVDDDEVSEIVRYLTDKNPKTDYDEQMEQQVAASALTSTAALSEDRDVYFEEAARFIIEKDKASIGMLQRMFKIGFNRAARIMDQLCEAGVVGPEEGTKPRNVLMSQEQFENYIEQNG